MQKNETQHHWFSRKRYGYGWGLPTAWQGWLSLALYIASMLLGGVILLSDAPDDTLTKEVGYFFGWVLFLTLILYVVVRKHAPKPKWQWGKNLNFEE
jgi:hypothetical protein